MTRDITIIYDNIKIPDRQLRRVVGDKRFSDIIYKRKSFFDHTMDAMPENFCQFPHVSLNREKDLELWMAKLTTVDTETAFLQLFSDVVIADRDAFLLLLQKLYYSQINIAVMRDTKPLLLFFSDKNDYSSYLNHVRGSFNCEVLQKLNMEQLDSTCLQDISGYNSFVAFLSGGFETRYFNSLDGSEYTVVKKSSDKEKIKKEYTFYHLLPESMRSWFVLPYDYKEGSDWASYTMERYHIADMAIRWAHRAITLKEMDQFLKTVMVFLQARKRKATSPEICEKARDKMYLEKLDERIHMLKQCKSYPAIAAYLKEGTRYSSIDEIVRRYRELYHYSQKKLSETGYLVIGHGDLCFNNILYDSEIKLLRLIDPRGALKEEELWMDPYYDLAKLSLSLSGMYDFIMNDVYDISLDENLQLSLLIDYNNRSYISLLRGYLEESGYSFQLARLYEASLYLTMPPLHIDNSRRMLAFILNAITIMDEVEQEWKA